MPIIIYTVRTGDTLWDLANEYDTSVEAIMDLNPQIKDPNKIYVGQRIKIRDNT